MAVFFARRGEPILLWRRLSDYAEGDIVKIPENGTPVEFYVAKHDYESELNGTGRTLLLRKYAYNDMLWGKETNYNMWEKSYILSYMNNTYKSLLDSNIQKLIGSTTYYYHRGGHLVGGDELTTRSDSIFILSATEYGGNDTFYPQQGSILPIADIIKIAYRGDVTSVLVNQWTRTLSDYDYYEKSAIIVLTDGDFDDAKVDSLDTGAWTRPVFTLPSTTKFDPDTNIIIG